VSEDADLRELDQLLSRMIRPIARASGAKEANISDNDLDRALQVLSLDVMSSAEERVIALRNIRDLIVLGPILMNEFHEDMGFLPRLNRIVNGSEATRAAERAKIQEAEAIEAMGGTIEGPLTFFDPATGAEMIAIR